MYDDDVYTHIENILLSASYEHLFTTSKTLNIKYTIVAWEYLCIYTNIIQQLLDLHVRSQIVNQLQQAEQL